jgi:hypothetical protein
MHCIITTALIFTSLFSFLSFAQPDPEFKQSIQLDGCSYRTANKKHCLDDRELMKYNQLNNDGTICTAQYFSICVDGMTPFELAEVEAFASLNQ